MRPITLLFSACLICLSTSVFGQLTTSFSLDPSTQPLFPIGSKVSVQVKAASGFNSLVGFQFPIGFNKDVLKFDSLNSYDGLPNFTAGSYNPQQSLGKISVSWGNDFFNYPSGITLPANGLMFIIHFTVLSVGSTNLNLIPNAQPIIEATNLAGTNVGINYQNTGLGVTTGDGTVTYTGFKVIANTLYIPQGMRGCMPVTVNDFDNIVTMQYAMHWNPAVLQYDCIRNIALGGLASKVINPDAGTQRVAWDDETGLGITRADGSRIYDICFTAIGQPGQQSAITIDGVGIAMEAFNSSSVNVWTAPAHPNGATPVGSTINIITMPPPSDAVTIMVDTITAVGTINNTCVPVKVKNFNTVTNAEFTLFYDNTQLTLVTPITLGGPLSLAASNLNTATAGQVRFTWSNVAGVTVANNTAIFSVCFNSGATTGTFPLELRSATGTNICGNPWSAIGAARKNVGGVPIKLENGFVKLPSGASVSITKTNLNCANVNNGTAQVKMSDNSTPILIKWAGPSPSINAGNMGSANLTNLAAGTYTVTVTLTGGATQTASTTITAPPAIVLNPVINPNTCFGGSTATITTNATGGTGALTYVWAGPAPFPGAITANISNLKAGTYTVTVRDANQCSSTYTATVTDSPPVTLLTSNINAVNPACFGINNGSITIAATGGTSPYTYTWNSGHTGATISNLGAGSYVPVITDVKGCSFTAQAIMITTPSVLSVTLNSKKDVKCKDGNDGGATITVTGGTPFAAPAAPYTYSWKNASQFNVSAQQNPSNLPAGTYTVLVTDSRGCTAVLNAPQATSVTIDEPGNALTASATVTNTQCFNSNTGAIALTIAGGWGNNLVSWSPSIPGGTNPINIPQGTYAPTITDLNGEGCSVTLSVTVTGPLEDISIGTPSVTGVACYGAGTGGIVIVPTGGNMGTYTAQWSYPNNPILSGLAIGQLEGADYTPTITDALGCTKVFPAVTVPEPLFPVSIGADSVIVDQNGNVLGSINISVSGGTPGANGYSYNWASGAQTQDLTNLSAGTYVVTVTDANGCSLIQGFIVDQANSLNGATLVTSVQDACAADGCINIAIAPAAPKPYNIKWTGPTPGEIVASFDNAVSICNLLAGTNYSITVTASNGNTLVLTDMVDQKEAPNFSSSSANSFEGTPSGSAEIFPDANNILSYQWSTAATTKSIQNLTPGMYTVTVTNTVSGCTAVQEFIILAQFLPLDVDNDVAGNINPKCIGDTNGAIGITTTYGKKPYVYLWSNGSTTEDLSGLAAGTYTVTVTDAFSATKTITATLINQSNLDVTNVNELSLTPGGYQVTGDGICDGKALVIFTGQTGLANILWSNGASTPQTNTLCGGAYSVTVTDQTGCSSVWADSLTSPLGIVSSTRTVSGIKCHDECNGIAGVTVNGGVQPYSVKWSNGLIDQQIFAGEESRAINLCAGIYTVTITDDNGVTRIINDITVVNPDPITITLSSPIEPTTFTSCDGQVMAVLTGATGIVRYEWTSNRIGKFGDTQLADNLCPGEVIRFDVEDSNGCAAFAYDTVPTPPDGCNIGRPVITPNDDNLNDFFIITCANNTENTVEIYNRWGQLVFEIKNYNDSNLTTRWNGTNKNNQPLPEGVYYFVYTYKDDSGTQVVEKGHINLMR